ncbi:Response regulator receiver domain-containing protein [Rhizobiales bacterium GAS113]|nr:Response regulator receiver domain-containing protein [Rhizobiales bacterium GAS113]
MSASIMVVDDESDVADLFRQQFRRESRSGEYVLHFAFSSEEALQLLEAGVCPELRLVLSDINMPGIDGLQLLTKLRKCWPSVPVMMVTAYDDDARRGLANRLGAIGFLSKPVDFAALRGQLHDLIGRHRSP